MVLVLPIHIFGEVTVLVLPVHIQTSKIHNLFIQYPNNTYFSALKSLKMGIRHIKVLSF
jgi:hypothetical protein